MPTEINNRCEPPASLQYAAELDGLRALAVLSVLFFHLDLKIFPGGFLGVDVFFVISGYLITRLIRFEIAQGSFTFKEFYIRRTRRLLPALFVTILATFLVALYLFVPADLARLGGAATSSVLSLSNFYFWMESGYFDTSAGSKPLLHTWSLSIEEQFYVLWPLCLVLLSKLNNKLLVPMIVLGAALVSLALAELMIEIEPSAAFYLLPFRIVEFAVGILLVWVVDKRSKNPIVLEMSTIVGLGLILGSVLITRETDRFPGAKSLYPCLGAALVIYGSVARKSGSVLRVPLAVHLGKISYSLYLVHWPIIVFYNYYNITSPEWWEKLVLIAVIVLVAQLMFQFIETPFRTKRNASTQGNHLKFGLSIGMLAFMIMVPATTTWAMKGWPWRFNISTEVLDPDIEARIEQNKHAVSQRSKKREILVLGDSIANDLKASLLLTDTLIEKTDYHLTERTKGGCRPVTGPSVSWRSNSHNGKACEAFFKKHYKAAIQSNPDIIFMYARWGGVPKLIPKVKKQLEDSVNLLLAETNAHIIFLDYPADYKKSVMEGAVLMHRMSPESFNRELESIRNISVTDEFDAYLTTLSQSNERLHLLKIKQNTCPGGVCQGFLDRNFLIQDQVHLTSWGKQKMAKALDEQIGLLMAENPAVRSLFER